MNTVKAVVQKIITQGPHGPYAVATSETLDGSVTFSLEPTVWQAEDWPEAGSVVLLSKIRRKRAGWRAKAGRFVELSDEHQQQARRKEMSNSKLVVSYVEGIKDSELRNTMLRILLKSKGEPEQVKEVEFIPASNDYRGNFRGEVDDRRSLVICNNGVALRLQQDNFRGEQYLFKLIDPESGKALKFPVFDGVLHVDDEYRQKPRYTPKMDLRAYRDIIKKRTGYDLPPVEQWGAGPYNEEFPYGGIKLAIVETE